MRYENSIPTTVSETERQRELSTHLEHQLGIIDTARRNKVLNIICSTVNETRNLLELPDDMDIFLHGDRLPEYTKGSPMFAEARVEEKTAQDGTVQYVGYITFNPLGLEHISEWELRAQTAHEMYHLRTATRFPYQQKAWQEKREAGLTEFKRRGHYKIRFEHAAYLFAMGYIKNRQSKNLKDKIEKILTLGRIKLTSDIDLKERRRIISEIP